MSYIDKAVLVNRPQIATESTVIDLGDCKDYALQYDIVAIPGVKTFASGARQAQTLTFPAKADVVNQDILIVSDTAGVKYGLSLVKPVAEVQTLTFPTKSASTNGDLVIVYDVAGNAYALAFDKLGTSAAIPSGPLWTAIPSDRKKIVNISAASTAASVAVLMDTAFNTLVGFTAAITTDHTAADGTMTLTQVVKGPTPDPVPKNATEAGAGGILGVQSTAGVSIAPPTGPLWYATNYRVVKDISAATDAASVAALALTALNTLPGFSAAITLLDNTDGTLKATQVSPGTPTAAAPYSGDESTAGTITAAQVVAYSASKIDPVTDTFTSTAHGYMSGLKGTLSTGTTLPGGTSNTTYWLIVTGADTFKLASTLANADALIAVDITSIGVGTQTFTPTVASISHSVQLSKSCNGTTWIAEGSAVAVSAAAVGMLEGAAKGYRYLQIKNTVTTGQMVYTWVLNAKK